jgi:hypothetical protein
MSLIDDIAALKAHYQSKCDGEWEHANGITIESTDNPGWQITLDGAPLDIDRPLPFRRGNPDVDVSWVACEASSGVIRGGCGINDLEELIQVVASMVRRTAPNPPTAP